MPNNIFHGMPSFSFFVVFFIVKGKSLSARLQGAKVPTTAIIRG